MIIKEVVRDDSARADQVKPDSSTSSQQIVLYDESLIEVEVMHYDYTIMSAHHYSFDPHVEDSMSYRCELTQRLYHPLWDEGLPSSDDGIKGCKYLD